MGRFTKSVKHIFTPFLPTMWHRTRDAVVYTEADFGEPLSVEDIHYLSSDSESEPEGKYSVDALAWFRNPEAKGRYHGDCDTSVDSDESGQTSPRSDDDSNTNDSEDRNEDDKDNTDNEDKDSTDNEDKDGADKKDKDDEDKDNDDTVNHNGNKDNDGEDNEGEVDKDEEPKEVEEEDEDTVEPAEKEAGDTPKETKDTG